MIRDGVRRFLHLALRRRDRWEREVEDEIKLHLAMRAEQLVAEGYTSDGAYAEAVRRFGPLEESRGRLLAAAQRRESSMQRTEWLEDLRQDVAFAARTFGREKGLTAVTVLTLALGIGAATAVFSAVSSLLLHPLSYPNADRIALAYNQPAKGNTTGIRVTIVPSAPFIRAWKANVRSFEAMTSFTGAQPELKTSGDPVELNAARVEPDFAHFAGTTVLRGRMFTAAEVARNDHVVLLGEGLWRSRFGGDDAVIGRAITLDDSLYTVIGVMPVSARVPNPTLPTIDAWLPLSLSDDRAGGQPIVRLRKGVTIERAQAELDSVNRRVAAERGDKSNFQSILVSPGSQLAFRGSLVLLAYAVALVLLVACANVAHLLLARATSRRRELAIRVALGAGRSRVFRQLLTESVLLAATGSALGLFGGWVGLRAIVAARPSSLSALSAARLDGTTLLVAIVGTAVTSLVFGAIGAVNALGETSHEALKTGTQRGGTARGSARNLLVVTEMAMSAMLVIGATMLVRSVINLQRADLGFEPNGLYTIRPLSPRGHFPSAAARGDFLHTLATRIGQMPGVQQVSMAGSPPGWWSFSIGRLEIEGKPAPPSDATEFIRVNRIETNYFAAMRQRLVAGGMFSDTTDVGNQVIVNQGFARKQWPGESAIGKRIRIAQSGKEPWQTIVGVAADASTGGPTVSDVAALLVYSPAVDSATSALMVRTSGGADVLTSVPALAHALDAGASVKVQSVEANIADAIAEPRFVMAVLMLFTGLALTLAAIGLYGVMAYTVSQRTREIGIRMALGATRTRIARSVVSGGIALAITGAVLGSALAAWGTKVIESQLFGVSRSDAVSFAAALAVLIVAAVAACGVPARRALAVDPMTAIRAD